MTSDTDPLASIDDLALTDTQLPDLYIDFRSPLLALGDGIITDRHHASAANYDPDDAMNQIGGHISAFAIGGWLRHGSEAIIRHTGATACHPGAADGAYILEDVYDRDLQAGYHEKGSCASNDTGCILFDLNGGFNNRPGKLIRHAIGFSPIRREVDVLDGEVEAHYRQLNTHVRSRNDPDGGQPLRHATRDVLANVTGTMRLTFREVKPAFVGLLIETIEFLDAHSEDFAHQLGGSRNFGAGIVDCAVLNPLYTDAEIKRVYNRAQAPTAAMERKDEQWAQEYGPQFRQALQDRLAADATSPIQPVEDWR
jgi:hypothetical protein